MDHKSIFEKLYLTLCKLTNNSVLKLKFLNPVLLMTMLVLTSYSGAQNYSQFPNESFSAQSIEELNNIDSSIESFRIKREFLKNVPSENEIALNGGWYNATRQSLRELFDKKREIIREQTQKEFVSIEEFEELPAEKQQKMLSSDNFLIEQN